MTPATRAELLRLLDLAEVRLRIERQDQADHKRGVADGVMNRRAPKPWASEYALGRIVGHQLRHQVVARDRARRGIA